jgi:sulfite reductase (NADPH) hemoprotein beta-component
MLTGLREVARIHNGEIRLTPNQNLIISGIDAVEKQIIERLFEYYGVTRLQQVSPLRREALACVALPTCGLAMAEAERYLPELNEKIEALLAKHALNDEAISLRITGCPNGCARPYLAEIGLVGKAPGRYNLFLGGSADGLRLNRLAHENLDEARILEVLDGLLARFVIGRQGRESFGDFADRTYAPLAETA